MNKSKGISQLLKIDNNLNPSKVVILNTDFNQEKTENNLETKSFPYSLPLNVGDMGPEPAEWGNSEVNEEKKDQVSFLKLFILINFHVIFIHFFI